MIMGFIFAFFCSVIFAVFLTFIFKRRGPGPYNGILYFFGIIFSFTLAMGIWLHPVGPRLWGIPWLAILGTGVFITLLIAELVPHHEKGRYVKTTQQMLKEEEHDEQVLQKEFSILIVIILAILIGAYIYALTHVLPEVTTGF